MSRSAPPGPPATPDPAETAAALPHLPGVYRMVGATGDVLYVGKAIDLSRRVSSYFQKKSALSPRIRLMIAQVARVETTVTRSEAEALLLENNLIKSLAPRYNILFRDDKSYPYLAITGHRFPRLAFHRGALDRRNRYFGPFPNAGAVRDSMQLLQKVFRVRTCEDTVFGNRSRPCLLHQIRRCTAPCVGLVSDGQYADDVRAAALFLSGREDEVVRRLEARMQDASARLAYEEAAVCRDQIAALAKVRDRQFISSETGRDADVVACAQAAGVTCVNLVMVRGGHHLGDRNFFPRNTEDSGETDVLEAFIAQHYLHHDAPPEIVVGVPLAMGLLSEALAAGTGREVRITNAAAGALKTMLDMAKTNARIGAEQHASLQVTQEARLTALHQALDLPEAAQRIECFDVSHTMGEATVASCVVYDRSAMQKSDYRHYNIRRSAAGDDYGAMREVLTRRYEKVVSGEGRMPDIVMIDGGKGQMGVAREVLAELGISEVFLLAVAKGEERKPGCEQLFVSGRDAALTLRADHPALHLIQQIRDEAHRFAITGHRAKRGKARTRSPLEGIAGVGAKRRQRLLARFGGLRGLIAASEDELARVDGIGPSLARKIYRDLH